jgi:hypothetical protein
MWIHERFDIGRPKVDLPEYQPLPEDAYPADLPTMGSLWCLWKVMTFLIVFFLYEFFSSIQLTFHVLCNTFGLGSSRRRRTRTSQVGWTPYAPAMVATHAPQGLSSLCFRDWAYWMTRRRLVFNVYVEEYDVHWVMRQFGLFQELPVPAAPRLPPRAHT